MGIATVDFSLFLSGTPKERQTAADVLVDSIRTCGFVRLVNHGVSLDCIQAAESWNRRFFALSPAQKTIALNVPSRKPQRGWSYMGAESTARLRQPNSAHLTDEKEHFDVGPQDDADFPNKWVESELPGFREASEHIYRICQDLCIQIMAACEVGCNVAPGTFVDRCKPAASELRYNYYPPVTLERLNEGNTQRGWPHTDFGLITLLFQDLRGGLQYEDRGRKDSFLDLIRETPDEIAVNVSDTFQRWTNGTIQAGVHRVGLPPLSAGNLDHDASMLPERHSTVFFFKAGRNTMVGALPPFISDEQPRQYDDITALEFHERMTEVLVDRSQPAPTS